MARSEKTARKAPSRPAVAEDIAQGLRNAIAFARGQSAGARVHRVPGAAAVDVRQVREKLGLSQADFAERFGFSAATLRNWEQGRRHPEGPARTLLTLIDRAPDMVQQVLLER